MIWMEKGPDACRRFLNNVQYSVNHWLMEHGFSMGIGDTVADTSTMRSINDIINKVICSVEFPCCSEVLYSIVYCIK